MPHVTADGFAFRENGRSGVSLLLGAIPVGRVFLGPDRLDVVSRAFGFLHANDVGLLVGEEVEEVAFEHGAQAVDVPGDELHAPAMEEKRGRVARRNQPQGHVVLLPGEPRFTFADCALDSAFFFIQLP